MAVGRKINFPNEYSLGSVYTAPAKQPESWELLTVPQGLITKPENQPISWEWFDEARGTIEVAPDTKVKLKVSASAVECIEALEHLGPDDLHVLDMSRTQATDTSLMSIRHMSGLRVLELAYTAITNGALDIILSLKNLHTLGLTNTGLSNSGIMTIGNFKHLRELWLNGTLIDDEGMEHLLALKELWLLGLSGTKVTGDGLKTLGALPALLRIYMFNTSIAESDVEQFRGKNAGCRIKWKRALMQQRPEFLDPDDVLLELPHEGGTEAGFESGFGFGFEALGIYNIEPMLDEEFWPIIDLLDWDSEGDDLKVIEPAIVSLAQKSKEEILAFEEALCRKLFALDGETYARHVGKESYRGRDSHFSKNWFLSARCCAVANGKEAYEEICAEPEKMPKDLGFKALCQIAPRAYEKKLGEEFSYVSRFGKETFSNATGWSNF
ncbi:MAG: DUF4240 domain-containing protein [Candidatus Obscuribacterales bacterium]|nr:DUF4240 domain-containing protein [Cyanobacteria bacterium HKST-UBA01]MCB9471369.1 DUF4240 domain-containing protein [Candidatus Obscuribacterales bacterium]